VSCAKNPPNYLGNKKPARGGFGVGALVCRVMVYVCPILPKDETWKVPENYSLPSVFLSAKDMPEWMKKRLKGYSKRNV
jgi:hypothetical protein